MAQNNATGPPRAPGSFSSTLTSSNISTAANAGRPSARRAASSSSEDSRSSYTDPHSPNAYQTAAQFAAGGAAGAAATAAAASGAGLSVSRQRSPRPPFYAAQQAASSTSSLQNFSRPTYALRPAGVNGSTSDLSSLRVVSPLIGADTSPSSSSAIAAAASSSIRLVQHGRKHSHTQGSFEPSLPSASIMATSPNPNQALSASQIAAQAAMQHTNPALRQRSLTVPTPQTEGASTGSLAQAAATRKRNGQLNTAVSNLGAGPMSPPLLSLTEASAPRENNFGGQTYHNGLLVGHTSAAQTAANVVFTRSPGASPILPSSDYQRMQMQMQSSVQAQQLQPKAEKSKVKLFSRPGKISINKDKEGKSGLPSPNNMSSASSMYSMANSSSATIRAIDQSEKGDKEKHKHHFLSRQKNKLSNKDDHHLPLSSASSNSKPVDPSAPSSLYNFSLPPSPGPTATSFAKSMTGLDFRHGSRTKDKKNERAESSLREVESPYPNEWPGPASLGSGAGYLTTAPSYAGSIYGSETQDLSKFGLATMTPEDAWPFLRSRLLIVFEGEDLRLPVEDFNRLVSMHLQRCIQKRAPHTIIEDLRDLITTGFSSLDQALRSTPDDRLIPHLVEMWLFTFTSVLPYMQAVFLPLDLEFSGQGPLMSRNAAMDFWGALPISSSASVPAAKVLEVRKIVLTCYRDVVILPRFDTLKTIFSRLSLESISLSLPSDSVLSASPDSFSHLALSSSSRRPSTALSSSLDPSHGSYGSQSTTLLGSISADGPGSRSRAISNVSYTSDGAQITSNLNGLGLGLSNMPPPPRPFTPSSSHPPTSTSTSTSASLSGSSRLRQLGAGTVEDSSRRLTETVGRMLQCMSVLASVGTEAGGMSTPSLGGPPPAPATPSPQAKMEELCRGLKLNWLGRGRMGRNRRGLVGARVPGGVVVPPGAIALAVGGAGMM